MNFNPSNLFYWMAKTYSDNKTEDNKIVFCNEGSSRSAKTFDAIHLIIAFCDHNKNKPLSIGIFRNTLKDSREKTYADFKKCLKIIGIYDKNCALNENQSPKYNLFGSEIEFRGLEEDTEQKGYDIVFVNEALEIRTESKIAGLKLRCRMCMIFDWNPKYTIHWVFEYEGRPGVYFSKTTYLNNKHLEKSIVTEIESRSPWRLSDLHLPVNERRPHKDNIKNGTADAWYFKVYGMGERANRDGLIFPNVTWVKELTKDTEKHFYGLDFGNTTGIYALTVGAWNQDGIHFDCPIYGSFANKEQIAVDSNSGLKLFWETTKAWLDKEGLKDKEIIVISDSAQPAKITDLNIFAERDGYAVRFGGCKKFPGCVIWRLDILNRHKIHFVLRDHIKKEQENYAYRTVHGIAINEPIDDFNHAFDAMGYSIQYEDYLR